RKERPSGSSGPNDKADCERDERLPWRHELASYLAIAGHPECCSARLGFIRLRRRNFPAVSSPGLATPPGRGRIRDRKVYTSLRRFSSRHPKSAGFSAIQIET